MRLGQNPAKMILHVAHPQEITVAVVTYIPFLSGYYAQGLEVLKVCLGSILNNTDQPFDLLVFDNASCPDVVGFLTELKETGSIQFLILSDKNIGKIGAWNVIFGAAPGKMIAYSDSDVYHYPGWLSKHLEVFETFPEAGTVCGLPRRGRRTFYTSTLEEIANLRDAVVDEGQFIPEAWITDHAVSLGKQDSVQEDLGLIDYRITRQGVSAYATATHFQFMVQAATVRRYLPFNYDRPMGDAVAHFDRAINGDRLLRLATADRTVRHLGNTLDPQLLPKLPGANRLDPSSRNESQGKGNAFYRLRPIRRLLLSLYDRIFRLYYG